jgi:hypothetical protein
MIGRSRFRALGPRGFAAAATMAILVAAGLVFAINAAATTTQYPNGYSPDSTGCDNPDQVQTLTTATIVDPTAPGDSHYVAGHASLLYSRDCGTSWVTVWFADALGAPAYSVYPSVWQQNTDGTDQHTASDPQDFTLHNANSVEWSNMVDADGLTTCGGVQVYRDSWENGTAPYVGWTYLGCRYASSMIKWGLTVTSSPSTSMPSTTTAQSTPSTTYVPPPTTYTEYAGPGPVHTWTDYSTGGGTEGQNIGDNAGVQVSCKVTGLRVSDGNTWWYQIASSPWNGSYYASADAFCNDGSTCGTLSSTPYVDNAVPNC